MKSSELMIGDWILYGERPVQVLQLTSNKIYRGFYPVPLTEEILQKNFPTPKEFERLCLQEPKPVVIGVGGPTPQKITHNGDIYVRRDVVEHIIRGSLGPKEALTKIRSL